MSSLQLGLIVAGALLVAGVLVYNWLQERRVRRRIRDAFSRGDDGVNAASAAAASTSTGSRIEPSLVQARGADALAENPRRFAAGGPDDDYAPPLEVHARIAPGVAAGAFGASAPLGLGSAAAATP